MNLEPLRELEEVRALVSKATPGPWRWSENGNLMAPGDRDVDEICAVYTERDDDAEPANAAAIRAAVNFIRTHGEALSRALAQIDDGWRGVVVAEIGELNGTKLIVGREEGALATLPKGTKLYALPSPPAQSQEIER